MKNSTTIIKKGAHKRFRAGTGVQRLHDRLIDLAYSSQPNAKLPSYQELCDSFGTSPSSLRQALDELEQRNIIYRKRGHGIYVSPKLHEKCVRIFFNSNLISRSGLSPFWGILSGLILSEAQSRGKKNQTVYNFDLVLASYFHDPAVTNELMKLYREGQVHGILAVGMGEHAAPWVIDADVPVVSYADVGHWQVGADIPLATHLGIDALIDLGCRTIGMWAHMSEDVEGAYSAHSYLSVLEGILDAHNLRFYPELTLGPRAFLAGDPGVTDLTYQEQGYITARKIYTGSGILPDGLFLADDMFAQGVMAAFNELGIKPGVDVHVVSMSNTDSPILYGYEELLTFVEYNPTELVAALFDVLDVLVSGRIPDPDSMIVKPRLVRPGDRGRQGEIMRRYGL